MPETMGAPALSDVPKPEAVSSRGDEEGGLHGVKSL
jgi:hypothetical protein